MLTTASPALEAALMASPAREREAREEVRRRVNPQNPLYEVLPDGSWRGEPCFVIGGGPSLLGFDFERLRGRGRVIAINRAFEHVPFADVLFFMDFKEFYRRLRGGEFGAEAVVKWDAWAGYRVFLNIAGRRIDEARHVRSLGLTGFSGSIRAGLYHGNNSGVGALGLAACLGADPIYLLGFDFSYPGKRTHFHGGYTGRRYVAESIVRGYAGNFEKLGEMLARRPGGGPKIINLSPESALKAFPYSSIDEVLA